jgi:hypothetical protein
MKINVNSFHFSVILEYQKQNVWFSIPDQYFTDHGAVFSDGKDTYCVTWAHVTEGLKYKMAFSTAMPAQLRLIFTMEDERSLYPVIPCNIVGDNHIAEAKPGEYPLLTSEHNEIAMCASTWEFRADRAAVPISGMCCERGAAALYIQPYSDVEPGQPGDYRTESRHGAFIGNGVITSLHGKFGVSLGYTNTPVTFFNRSIFKPSTRNTACKAEAEGILYAVPEGGRQALHKIVRQVYRQIHVRATYQKQLIDAAEGLLDTFCTKNFDQTSKEYTNMNSKPPERKEMRPWRNVVEIGWTGGSVLAYPLILSRSILGEKADLLLQRAMPGEAIFDRICGCYNPKSGLLNDLMAPIDDSGSLHNGWWTGYGLVKNCHCAYTVGSAVHYMLKSMDHLRNLGKPMPEKWLRCCIDVLDTVIQLQREDGALGYTYSPDERRVLDFSGFAGCWFAAAMVYLYRFTGDEKYLRAAKKSAEYYHTFVQDLNCYGSPMDTWKSIDQEGNLAFIRTCRLLHEETGDALYLDYLKQGAEYEFLWRYAYPTRPEFTPLNDGWNACGGSFTSISNPHIHPMGVIADSDLHYLGEKTKDDYYISRAQDSTAWMMQCLELYPEKTGYGCYGVLSERWCPSDDLTVERFSDGRPYSSWFSYNLWAAACVMEAVCERLLDVSTPNA